MVVEAGTVSGACDVPPSVGTLQNSPVPQKKTALQIREPIREIGLVVFARLIGTWLEFLVQSRLLCPS